MYKQPKPIIRADAYSNLHSDFNRAIEKLFKDYVHIPFQNCLNCVHWEHGKDQCGLYKAKPPAEIIVYSCDSYADNDDIPF